MASDAVMWGALITPHRIVMKPSEKQTRKTRRGRAAGGPGSLSRPLVRLDGTPGRLDERSVGPAGCLGRPSEGLGRPSGNSVGPDKGPVGFSENPRRPSRAPVRPRRSRVSPSELPSRPAKGLLRPAENLVRPPNIREGMPNGPLGEPHHRAGLSGDEADHG
uniref:Uncharacterized protein n=1 Tax=Candidatus Kentrum eta TaxID=2126337 RepID=A0A450V1P6_9GAMM|nr:MAG: hypothetical protein BECKH772A_GA0070896_100266 [Candidatus Kentron sp. H]VFJ92013.1 MAG: hypothetical protein BECKH772B_GA0070898_100246 [Candidatus Kentron sp. H]VFJ98596.1 MAG: hypothetical protein BECKH772C_GA0070978_100236 [Candidatus Kentron sp. H]